MIANDMCQNTTHLGRNKGSYCSINSPECGWVVVCLLFKLNCGVAFGYVFGILVLVASVCIFTIALSACVRLWVFVCQCVCVCLRVFVFAYLRLCACVCVCFFIRSNKSEIILKLNKHSCQL